MKILSILLLSTALFCGAHAAEDQMPPQKGKSALIQSVIEAPSFAENRLPASFEARFKDDSAKVKNAISTFFKDSDELKDRLKDFHNAYEYGASLFKEREDHTAHSRKVALVYLSYAALMSKETTYFLNQPSKKIEFKNPQEILNGMNNYQKNHITPLFNNTNILFLPILSKTGFLSIPQINQCYSKSIAIFGIPYASQNQNTFDTVKDASPMAFAHHDVDHFADFCKQNMRECYQNIYEDMQKNKNMHVLDSSYFIVAHEFGGFSSWGHLDPNPIQNAINHMKQTFIHSSKETYAMDRIMQNPYGFRADESSDFKKPMDVQDVTILQNISYANSMFLTFQLQSQPNETFLLNSVSYTQMMEQGIDLAKLLNSYGANLGPVNTIH